MNALLEDPSSAAQARAAVVWEVVQARMDELLPLALAFVDESFED